MSWLDTLGQNIMQAASGLQASVLPGYTFVIRFLLPILAVIILWRCIKSLLREKQEPETWGYLSLPNGARIQLNHWENVIGRSKSSDVFMEYPTLSRSHAALTRGDLGDWRVIDLGSKGGIKLNNKQVHGEAPVKSGDLITLGGIQLVFVSMTNAEEREQAELRTKPGRVIRPGVTLVLLTEFQILLGLELTFVQSGSFHSSVPLGFLALIAIMWIMYLFTRSLRRVAFEVETVAFFLSTIGLAVCASAAPSEIYKQIITLVVGLVLFFGLSWFLRDLDRAKKLRWPIAIAGLVFLFANLLLSQTIFGAKNWLYIGGISFQPSEYVKIAFVFAGAATLDRLFAKRNLILFIGFSALCVIVLGLMSDFGTAAIFFVVYLVIAFLRSGDFATVFLSIGGAGLAGFLAVTVKPYIAGRFATWGKAWSYANAGGYQQTRTMAAAASGGLFGIGAGRGWLKGIAAANTDMVFGVVCEELGLIIALLTVFSIVTLVIFAVKSSATARSSYYVIAACAAGTILLFQVILNVFGSLDILPFTGVTFPFVSKGGSSLIASWGLLAFIKACDTRQNASVAIRLPKRRSSRTERMVPEE